MGVPGLVAVSLILAVFAGGSAWMLWRIQMARKQATRPHRDPPRLVRREPQAEDKTTTMFLEHHEMFVAAARAQPLAGAATVIYSQEQVLAAQRAMRRELEPARQVAAVPVESEVLVDEVDPEILAAEQAFVRWQRARESLSLQQLADGPERVLQQALRELGTKGGNLHVEGPAARRQAIILVLLSRNPLDALELIDRLVGDPEQAPIFSEVLELWQSRETSKHLCEQARRARDTKPFWLDLLDQLRLDPGPVLLRELLASDDPELLVRGLGLAKNHPDAELRRSAMQTHLHDMHPQQQMAAVELGIFDSEPEAWTLCRQLANAPEHPRAIELVATFGTARELTPLLRELGSADGAHLWRLCRSGRKAAAGLAARRLQDIRGDTLAATGLRYIIGNPEREATSAEVLLEHWHERAQHLEGDRRYLYGELFGSTVGIRQCLGSRDLQHQRALGDELFVRSMGKIRWPGHGFAKDTLARLAAVGTPYLEYETG